METIKRTSAKRKARKLAKHLRDELDIQVKRVPQILPDVPTEEEIGRYYQAVWKSRNLQDIVIIKTFLYTGVRASELVNILLKEVDYDRCQIRISLGKGDIAGIKRNIYPHRLRHFLLTWLKKQGIDDSLIQLYSGHSTRQSQEIYSRLSINEAQKEYDRVMEL